MQRRIIPGTQVVITVIFIFITLTTSAQYPWPPQGEEDVDYYLNSKDKPDGLHYRTYAKGEIYYVGEFEGGKPKANTDLYYYQEDPKGTIMSIHHFSDDVNVVEAETFHITGGLMSKGRYVNQKKEGEWTFVDKDGHLMSKEQYLLGKRHGKTKTFFLTGKLFKLENYNHDMKNGVWEEYFEDGTLEAKGYHTHDMPTGEFFRNHPNGNKKVTGSFKKGLMEGTWLTFHSDGRIEMNTKYKEGKKVAERKENGTFMDYYENGIPKNEYVYEDAKKNGPFTEWFNQGEFIKEATEDKHANGGLQYTERLVGTQVQREGDYLNDKLEGELVYYNEDGRIIKTEVYSDGELQSTKEN